MILKRAQRSRKMNKSQDERDEFQRNVMSTSLCSFAQPNFEGIGDLCVLIDLKLRSLCFLRELFILAKGIRVRMNEMNLSRLSSLVSL